MVFFARETRHPHRFKAPDCMKQIRPHLLVVLLVACGLLVAGMRVPDISRPHRPKPAPRAVITSHSKVAPELFKQHYHDFVVLTPSTAAIGAPTLSRPLRIESIVAPPGDQLITNAGRSPPSTC